MGDGCSGALHVLLTKEGFPDLIFQSFRIFARANQTAHKLVI